MSDNKGLDRLGTQILKLLSNRRASRDQSVRELLGAAALSALHSRIEAEAESLLNAEANDKIEIVRDADGALQITSSIDPFAVVEIKASENVLILVKRSLIIADSATLCDEWIVSKTGDEFAFSSELLVEKSLKVDDVIGLAVTVLLEV